MVRLQYYVEMQCLVIIVGLRDCCAENVEDARYEARAGPKGCPSNLYFLWHPSVTVESS